MKKIICGLAIALCLCASVFAKPTEAELTARGIEMMKGGDGQNYPVYSVINLPEKGKQYMCLSWDRTTQKKPNNYGFYSVMLHEVIESTDENSVEVNGTYIRYYPSLMIGIGVDAVELGTIIEFDTVETLFGKEWVVARTPWDNWGYQTTDSVLGIEVAHRFKNYAYMIEKEKFDAMDIELVTADNGYIYLFYKKGHDLESGKTYMCLNDQKQKNFAKDENGTYVVYFYEIVDKTHTDAYKLGSKYITSYPVCGVRMWAKKKPKVPAEITFDGTLKFLFDKNWDIRDKGELGIRGNPVPELGGVEPYHSLPLYHLYEK